MKSAMHAGTNFKIMAQHTCSANERLLSTIKLSTFLACTQRIGGNACGNPSPGQSFASKKDQQIHHNVWLRRNITNLGEVYTNLAYFEQRRMQGLPFPCAGGISLHHRETLKQLTL
eukprot:3822326-Amphidinium_carterae.1